MFFKNISNKTANIYTFGSNSENNNSTDVLYSSDKYETSNYYKLRKGKYVEIIVIDENTWIVNQ